MRIRRELRAITAFRQQLLQIIDRADRGELLAAQLMSAALGDLFREFRQRKRIEPQIFYQARRRGDLDALLSDLLKGMCEPWNDLLGRRLLLAAMLLEHPPQQFRDFGPFDLAGPRPWQIAIGKAQDADAFVRAQMVADLVEVRAQTIFDRPAAFAAGISGDNQRRHLLGAADGQTHHGHLLDIRRMAVGLLELIDINVVAAGIDDYVLGASDDI